MHNVLFKLYFRSSNFKRVHKMDKNMGYPHVQAPTFIHPATTVIQGGFKKQFVQKMFIFFSEMEKNPLVFVFCKKK